VAKDFAELAELMIKAGPEGLGKYHGYDEGKQELKNSPDVVMCVVRSFENDRIDTSLLPHHKGTPEESSAEISEEIKWKEISQ
jgi:hypothetical protein